MKINKQLRWTVWAGLMGIVLAAVLVVLYRFTQNTLFSRTLLSVDRFGVSIASWATGMVFPGDRISYPFLSASLFFDVALILVTGLQTAVIGAGIGFILCRRSSRRT